MKHGLAIRGLLLAVFTALCSGVGVALIKAGLAGQPLQLLTLSSGLLIYGIGLVCGVAMLRAYPLSIFYPIVVGLSVTVLAVISATYLGEAMTPFKLGGSILIVLGVIILVQGPPRPASAAGPIGDFPDDDESQRSKHR